MLATSRKLVTVSVEREGVKEAMFGCWWWVLFIYCFGSAKVVGNLVESVVVGRKDDQLLECDFT
jgi:hypothetical protein